MIQLKEVNYNYLGNQTESYFNHHIRVKKKKDDYLTIWLYRCKWSRNIYNYYCEGSFLIRLHMGEALSFLHSKEREEASAASRLTGNEK